MFWTHQHQHPDAAGENVFHSRAEVSEHNGGLEISLSSILDADPDTVYAVLTDRNPERIFRGLSEVTYRHMVEEDGHGRRHFEVGHKAVARFLCFAFHIETCSLVWEDDNEKRIWFRAAKEGGTMKAFDGGWEIRPILRSSPEVAAASASRDTANLTSQHHYAAPEVVPAGGGGKAGPNSRRSSAGAEEPPSPLSDQSWLNAGSMVTPLMPGLSHRKDRPLLSMVSLQQKVIPRHMPPPGIKGVMKAMCAKQLQGMMEDLQLEINRRQGREEEDMEEGAVVSLSDSSRPGSKHGSANVSHCTSCLRGPPAAAASTSISTPTPLWHLVAPINITISQ